METERTIKELVELVYEGKVNTVSFDDEIERVKYIIYKEYNDVFIQKTDMDKKEKSIVEIVYDSIELENHKKELYEKAKAYVIDPYPQVSSTTLTQYRIAISEMKDAYSKKFNEMKEHLEILKSEKYGHYSGKREKLKEDLLLRLKRSSLDLEHLNKELRAIDKYISNEQENPPEDS